VSRPETRGPSRCVLFWTLYVLLVLTAAVAIVQLLIGGWLASLGATALLWRVITHIGRLAGK
jgi:type IV secretory pathway TrbL component